jgi:hypothetical protein
MQKFIAWWCELIGVTDPEAIRVATGVAAIAVGALIILWIFNTIAGVIAGSYNRRHDQNSK